MVTKVKGGVLDESALSGKNMTGDIAFDTTTLKIDSSNNRVGIGTSSPSSILHVAGTSGTLARIVGTNPAFDVRLLFDAGGTTGQIQYAGASHSSLADTLSLVSSGDIRTVHAGSQRVTIKSDGKVGIGTTSPVRTLQVHTAGSNSSYISINNGNTGATVSDGVVIGAASDSVAYFWNYENAAMAFATNNTERMRIDSSGNVNISGSLETAQTVAKAISLAGTHSGGNYIEWKKSGSAEFYIGSSNTVGAGSGYYDLYAVSGYGQRFFAGAAEAMRITSGGKLFINTTAAVRGSETVSIDGGSADCFALKTHAAGAVIRKQSVSNGFLFLFENSSASAVGSITTDASNTTYNTSSDYRLKENIEPMQNGLERLNQLNPVKFSWKETGIKSEGFIAHEVDEVFSDCIYGKKDGEEIQSMDYGRITPLLVKAIQEQQEQIEELKAKLENK